MTEKKNWWITVYDGEVEVVEEWIAKNQTKLQVDGVMETMTPHYELRPGVYMESWSTREAVVTIEVKDGVVQDVLGLPDGWLYQIVDL